MIDARRPPPPLAAPLRAARLHAGRALRRKSASGEIAGASSFADLRAGRADRRPNASSDGFVRPSFVVTLAGRAPSARARVPSSEAARG